MKNIIAVLSILMLIVNFTLAQELKYNRTNDENVFYRFDKKDSAFTFKIKYAAINDSYIVTDLDLSIEIDSLMYIKLREIPYNLKTKEFEVHIPTNNTQAILKTQNIDLYLSVRQIGDTETICVRNIKGCLTREIIHDNIK